MNGRVTLVIDLAIGRGKISLWRGTEMIDDIRPGGGAKRSEDVLEHIDKLLRRNAVAVTEIDRIVCSKGPGAYTGIRIGLATAMGLSRGANIEVLAYSTHEILLSLARSDRRGAALIDAGRNEYVLATDADSLQIVKKTNLRQKLDSLQIEELVLGVSDWDEKGGLSAETVFLTVASDNVTHALFALSEERPEHGVNLSPVYGREFRSNASKAGIE